MRMEATYRPGPNRLDHRGKRDKEALCMHVDCATHHIFLYKADPTTRIFQSESKLDS